MGMRMAAESGKILLRVNTTKCSGPGPAAAGSAAPHQTLALAAMHPGTRGTEETPAPDRRPVHH